MTSRRRRQTRSRRFGPGVWAPYEHNKAVAQRKALRRLQASAEEVARAFRQLSRATVAARTAVDAVGAEFLTSTFSTVGFNTTWAIREQTELDRTRSHAHLLGMDEIDADRMIEDFRLTRGRADGIRGWEDLRDEITDHCLGFGTARLIG